MSDNGLNSHHTNTGQTHDLTGRFVAVAPLPPPSPAIGGTRVGNSAVSAHEIWQFPQSQVVNTRLASSAVAPGWRVEAILLEANAKTGQSQVLPVVSLDGSGNFRRVSIVTQTHNLGNVD